MTALLLAAAFCQWPLPEPEVPTYHICQIEAIEVNTYYDYAGNEAAQLLFWEQDRWDTKGKRWGVYKGYTRFDGEGLAFEDNQFVYRGKGSDCGRGCDCGIRDAGDVGVQEDVWVKGFYVGFWWKYSGLLSVGWGHERGECWCVHILPCQYWLRWGPDEAWYDGPIWEFGFGPFLLITWC